MKQLYILIPMIAGVIYHLGQKRIRPELSPFVIFAMVYGISALLMLAGEVRTAGLRMDGFQSLKSEDVLPLALILVGVVGIEFGFLAVYRNGLPLNLSALASNIGQGLILILIGGYFYKEGLSASQLLGVGVSLAGLYLMKG